MAGRHGPGIKAGATKIRDWREKDLPAARHQQCNAIRDCSAHGLAPREAIRSIQNASGWQRPGSDQVPLDDCTRKCVGHLSAAGLSVAGVCRHRHEAPAGDGPSQARLHQASTVRGLSVELGRPQESSRIGLRQRRMVAPLIRPFRRLACHMCQLTDGRCMALLPALRLRYTRRRSH